MVKKDDKKKKANANVLSSIFGKSPDEREVQSEAENIKEIITEWLHPKHIKRKTRLTKKQ